MAFIYHIKAVFSEQSFAHVGVERQTNIQTYIHTNTYTLFGKTNIAVNQACTNSQSSAGCGRTSGLKITENCWKDFKSL